ncbi:Beta-xylosidase, GH43 family [Cnuella takakiae]|uniref:Beta-xylosidase, GH43 family n=2 Tax=Cnuella takakiae TaxID=1302690 RepID=A0A1M5BY12_9BACT|nr:glycoside hydrolase family 43 protein [Cnuella takakiae]SHF47331.1 Beta-xylosidase, GH43 family [Cnuella takakiae]
MTYKNLNLNLVLFTLLAFTACSKKSNGGNGTPLPRPDTAFINPLVQGSDPWVIQQDTNYFYTHTLGNRVALWKTGRMSRLAFAPQTNVFTPAAGGANSANVWAPELHRLDGKWYLYYTAGAGPDSTQRLWVAENESADPTTGTWTDRGRVFAAGSDFWSIDATVLEYGGSRYLVWSGRPSTTALNQNLYIARMVNPWTLEAQATMISEPTLSWERNGHPVNEGPQVLINPQGKAFLTYSASSCFTDDYALGLLSLREGGNPLNAADWTKSQQPVFVKNTAGNAYGPGHNAFFKSRNGAENWIIYHANTNTGEGCGVRRNIRMQRFRFDASGVPQFGTPVSAGTAVRRPAGE